jgi:hypothetical protein
VPPISPYADVRDELIDLKQGALNRAQAAGRRSQEFAKEAFFDFMTISPAPDYSKLISKAIEMLHRSIAEAERAITQLNAADDYEQRYQETITRRGDLG